MNKIELLSPAGNMECLISAVNNGADAVYLGGKKFGARHFATNFDKEEMIKAIKYCHLYGVKIYVTVNTMVYEEEIEEALDYIEFLYDNNVDALIMQDIGLISLVREKYPNMEIHASTQFHNHNEYGLELLKKLGIKRVVLARELSLDEIKNFKTDIDKEVFIHGALCVSYSGCCLFSAMHGGRSGNRGECVGSCRLPYKLYENDKIINTDGNYLLSTRSLCTINNIDKIIESGVKSLKIEGRMKSKEYVGYITRLYRNKIDEYYKNKKYIVNDEEIKNIKKLYNRELTEGYLFNKKQKELINIKTSNHIGINIGNVISYDNQYIKIKLTDNLYQEDGIRFDNDNGMIVNRLYNEKGLLVNKVEKGNIALVDNKIGLKKTGPVRKTIDSLLTKEINSYKPKKIQISFNCKIRINENIKLTVIDESNNITIEGNKVEKSINCPISKERIIEQLNKTGDTPFEASKLEIDMDEDVFVSIKELNELRRNLLNKLKEQRENYTTYPKIKNIIENKTNKVNDKNHLSISILVRNEEQMKVALNNKINYIYTPDIALYKKYKKDNVYLRTNRVNNNCEYSNENLLVTEIGGIYKYSNNNKIRGDYYLNIANNSTIRFLNKYNTESLTLSPELNNNTIKSLANNDNVELLIYGRVELMITKYCPINLILHKDNSICNLCYKNKYELEDTNGNRYPLLTENHLVHILDSKPIDLLDNLNSYISNGINNFRIELYDESEKEIEKIIDMVRYIYEHRNNK